MSRYSFNPNAARITKARLAQGGAGVMANGLLGLAGIALAGALALGATGGRLGLSLAGIGLLALIVAVWLKRDVLELPAAPIGSTTALDQLLPIELAARYQPQTTPTQLWALMVPTWHIRFALTRLTLPPDFISPLLANAVLDPDQLWDEVIARSRAAGLVTITPVAILAAFARLVPNFEQQLTRLKLTPADLDEISGWVGRLDAFQTAPNPFYGGFARDWAVGFTPLLQNFGQNLSRQVEYGGRGFGLQERTNQLDALVTGLGSASGSVALIGEPGIGKTALLYGLADRLLRGQDSAALSHHQIFALNASVLVSGQQQAGNLEKLVLQLLSEAAHAGNIILALDEAQLFFGQGTGAVNLSQVLLPILQNRNIKLILALSPGDWQKLKATAPAMTNLLTPLVLTEPSQADTTRLLADRSIVLEGAGRSTTYQAIIAAQRLSARYFQDQADPGRSLHLLEAAMNYAEGPFVTATSVERAIESQLGVKVQKAGDAESDVLLHLEDRIHQRMINQTRAVSVVAAALRRARAGVANPKRPIGSFLFLGPTGVGKTELARSVAALYFGAEQSMIRLDMSEYQRPEDVTRLLADAATNPDGLLPKIRTSPFSVVLFDEIEKAHPNLLNLFLQLLDEGQLTDASNKPASFKDAIVIATSNAGADEIRRRIQAGEQLEAFEDEFTDQLINSGQFKPELLNRFDEIVLFRPLNKAELGQVIQLLIKEVNRTLEPQKIQVALTDAAAQALVDEGYDPRLGARPMRRMVQRRVEDAVAGRILRGEAQAGTTITLDVADLNPAIPATKLEKS